MSDDGRTQALNPLANDTYALGYLSEYVRWFLDGLATREELAGVLASVDAVTKGGAS